MLGRRKLLARAWLLGRGCCDLRSPGIADAEARDLLDAAREAIAKAQESGVLEEVPGTKDLAFVLARRAPDLDDPGRAAPRFALVSIPDPDAFLRDAVAHLLRNLEIPEASDTSLDDWVFLDPRVTACEATGGSGSESRPVGSGILVGRLRYW